MAEEFIKRTHKRYIGNNSEEINKKYFYVIHYEDNIHYIYKKQNNKYNDIITNSLEFKYINKDTRNMYDHAMIYYVDNDKLYINNDFLIKFIDNYINDMKNINNVDDINDLDYLNDIILQCDKIIIDYDNNVIEKYLINNNIKNIKIDNLEGHTIIFENGDNINIDLIECYNFISNSNKINQTLNDIICNNFIVNKELININTLHILNKIIINTNSLNKAEIKYLVYEDDINNLKLFENYYIINTLNLNGNQKIVDFKYIYNIDITNLNYNIILENNINNSQLFIDNHTHINFNNYKINKLFVFLNTYNNINYNNYIKKILKNNSINELTIQPYSKKYYYNQIIDFQNIKLNKLNIYKKFKITNTDNINEINKISFK